MKQACGALLFSLGLVQILPAFGGYVWPAQTDDLEDVIFNDSGFGQAGIGSRIQKCLDEGRGGKGSQVAAAWLRTTYHDMATYRIAEGAGGVDASITFETDRAENVGIGFNNTFMDLLPGYNSRVPFSDMLAAAAYFALRKCGGPPLRVRAGRIDAHAAGPFGVPDPFETLRVQRHKFERAGRNQTQMIMMVACGHSFGGIHGNDFPLITRNSDRNFTQNFDSTPGLYDNHIALDFISSNTSNPLASGPRMSQSDFRIFSSDNNVTITRMSTPQGFRQICQDTITQMINTVPSDVKLTDIIEPSPIRPFKPQLSVNPDGSVTFNGQIRAHTTDVADGDKLMVDLVYVDGKGMKSESNVIHTKYLARGFGLDFHFDYYDINANLPNGISSFTIEVTDSNGKKTTYDNGGNGFPMESTVVSQQALSCFNPNTQTATVYAAVSNSVRSRDVKLEVYDRRPQQDSLIPLLVKGSVHMTAVRNENYKGYNLYKGTYKYATAEGGEYSIVANADGKRVTDAFKFTSALNNTRC